MWLQNNWLALLPPSPFIVLPKNPQQMKQQRGSRNSIYTGLQELSGPGSRAESNKTSLSWAVPKKLKRRHHAAANDSSNLNLSSAERICISSYSSNARSLRITTNCLIYAPSMTRIRLAKFSTMNWAHKLDPGPRSSVMFWWHKVHSNPQQVFWCRRITASHIPQLPIFQCQTYPNPCLRNWLLSRIRHKQM